jgi:predicted negative regulator of RcsB-dependent stress response
VAEIPIERKPRGRLGPLLVVLLIVIVLAAAWYWWSNSQKTSATTANAGTAVLVAAPNFAERIYG